METELKIELTHEEKIETKRDYIESFMDAIEKMIDYESYKNDGYLPEYTLLKLDEYNEEIHQDRLDLLNLEVDSDDDLYYLIVETIVYLPVTETERKECIKLITNSGISEYDKYQLMEFLTMKKYIKEVLVNQLS